MSKANAVKVFDTTICAESQSSGGACKYNFIMRRINAYINFKQGMGDSGGPLVANNIIIGNADELKHYR